MKSPSPASKWIRRAPAALAPVVLLASIALGALVPLPASAATPEPTAQSLLGDAVGHEPSRADSAAVSAVERTAPLRKEAAAPPSDIVITTPSDPDMVFFVHGSRTVTIAGRAPANSVITLNDRDDRPLGTKSTGASGEFTFTVTFSDSVSWDQLLVIDGKSGSRTLTEQLVEVQFDAPDTEIPVITAPIPGETLEGGPTPFGGDQVFAFVSGTSRAGDEVFVYAESLDPDKAFDSTGAFATADADGRWTAKLTITPGSYRLTPVAQTIDDELGPLSGYTDGELVGPVGVELAPDSVIPPTIDDPVTVTHSGDDYSVAISGTGTPGSGVQLYFAGFDEADRYLEKLYPGWFDDSTAAPSAVAPPYDGKITVGADGRWSTVITVGAGEYTVGAFTVDTRDPANLRYSVISNDPTIDTADAATVASGTGTGTPSPAPSATAPATVVTAPELASTGSATTAPILLALGLMVVGVSLRLGTRRRRTRR